MNVSATDRRMYPTPLETTPLMRDGCDLCRKVKIAFGITGLIASIGECVFSLIKHSYLLSSLGAGAIGIFTGTNLSSMMNKEKNQKIYHLVNCYSAPVFQGLLYLQSKLPEIKSYLDPGLLGPYGYLLMAHLLNKIDKLREGDQIEDIKREPLPLLEGNTSHLLKAAIPVLIIGITLLSVGEVKKNLVLAEIGTTLSSLVCGMLAGESIVHLFREQNHRDFMQVVDTSFLLRMGNEVLPFMANFGQVTSFAWLNAKENSRLLRIILISFGSLCAGISDRVHIHKYKYAPPPPAETNPPLLAQRIKSVFTKHKWHFVLNALLFATLLGLSIKKNIDNPSTPPLTSMLVPASALAGWIGTGMIDLLCPKSECNWQNTLRFRGLYSLSLMIIFVALLAEWNQEECTMACTLLTAFMFGNTQWVQSFPEHTNSPSPNTLSMFLVHSSLMRSYVS